MSALQRIGRFLATGGLSVLEKRGQTVTQLFAGLHATRDFVDGAVILTDDDGIDVCFVYPKAGERCRDLPRVKGRRDVKTNLAKPTLPRRLWKLLWPDDPEDDGQGVGSGWDQ